MNRPAWLVMIGLCCVLNGVAVGCRRGEQAEVAPEQPAATAPPGETGTASPGQAGTTPPDSGDQTPTPSPPTSPAPGSGGQGTAINPPQAAQLIAAQPESRINLRSSPSTDSKAKGYGLVGDPVQLLRSTKASDGTWYYVKFEQSGAEGWIRGDFINVEGRAKELGDRAAQSRQCEGLMESVVFTAYYDADGFHLVRFTNLETQSTFDSSLSRQGSNNQGQPIYTGSASPPTGGSYAVQLTDLSSGDPRGGSQVALNYSDLAATGTCQ